MRKIVSLLSILILTACSEDKEDNELTCTNRLWLLEKVCDPPQSQNCVYFATFGETAASAGTMQVQVDTYNYYDSRGNTSDGSICWEGTQED